MSIQFLTAIFYHSIGIDEHVRRPKRVLALQGKKVISISTGMGLSYQIEIPGMILKKNLNIEIQVLFTVLFALSKEKFLRGATTMKASWEMEQQREFTNPD